MDGDLFRDLVMALEDEIDTVQREQCGDVYRLSDGRRERIITNTASEDGRTYYWFSVQNGDSAHRLRSGTLEVRTDGKTLRIPAVPVRAEGRSVLLALETDLGASIPDAQLTVSDSGILEATLERLHSREALVRSAGARLFGGDVPVLPPLSANPGYDSRNLDRWQWVAVEVGARAPVSVVQGPPGTGKTATAGHLIARIVKEGGNVTVAAPTNRATDLLLLSALDALGWSPGAAEGRVARVGKVELPELRQRFGSAVDWDAWMQRELRRIEAAQRSVAARVSELRVRQWQLEGTARDEVAAALAEAEESAAQLRVEHGKVLGRPAQDAQILAVTSCRAALNRNYFGRGHIVLDETGMCSLPHILLLMSGARHTTLFGDPQQLGPIVHSRRSSTRQALSRSPLGPLLGTSPGSPPVPTVLLRGQYRMRMAEFVSRLSYAGQLQAHPDSDVTLPPGAGETGHSVPGLHWLILSGELHRAPRPQGGRREKPWECRAQARLVAAFAQRWIATNGYGKGDIAIITPFRSHEAALREEVRKLGLGSTVEVCTVHRMQGQERNAVILSLPDSPGPTLGGFLGALELTDEGGRLLTVAISRASRDLVVAGDLSSLARKAPKGGVLDRLLRLLKELGQPAEVPSEVSEHARGDRR